MNTTAATHIHERPTQKLAHGTKRRRWLTLIALLLILGYLALNYFVDLDDTCGTFDFKARRDGCYAVLHHADHSVQDVAFTPDGQSLVTATSDGMIRIWSVADQELRLELRAHKDWIIGLAIAPDGATIASASWDQTVRLWRTADGAPLRTLEGHTSNLWDVAIAPDGATMASISHDEAIIWSMADGSVLHRYDEVDSGRSVAFSPDSRQLAISDHSGVTIWELATQARRKISTARTIEVLLFSPDGTELRGGSHQGVLYSWTLADAFEDTLPHGDGSVTGLAFSPDGSRFASAAVMHHYGAGNGPAVRVWPDRWLRVEQDLELDSHATSVAFAPDGKTLAIGSFGRAYLWRLP